jgi:hypothetical protein
MAQAVRRRFSARKPMFDLRSFQVRFMVEKLALEWGFLRVLLFSLLNTHLHPHVSLPRRTNWLGLGTFQKAMLLTAIGALWIQKYFHFF